MLTREETFKDFKDKIEVGIQGEISQMSWMDKTLDIKAEYFTDSMEDYLERFLHNHPKGMVPDDFAREDLNIAVQAIGGCRQQ